MHRWIEVLVTTMMRRILQGVFRWYERISIQLGKWLGMKRNGLGFFKHGNQALSYYIHTASMSSIPIKPWLLSYFALRPMNPLSLSMSMLKLAIDTLAALTEWMIAVDSSYHCYHKCCVSVKLLTLSALRSVLRFLVKIGALGYAPIPVLSGVSMGFVQSVEESTKHETMKRASLLSKLAAEKDLAQATQTAEAAILEGPKALPRHSLKRHADTIIAPPRFRRRLVWSDSNSNTISPAALYTETAPPFYPPPIHLIEHPDIQSSLDAMKDAIKVDTPFNIDKFEALLEDHPNQPFVRSVMQGLREGFWPFDEGDWKNDQNDLSDNFATLPEDLAAIRSFRDKELQADRWSSPLPISALLPGMKFSPMFVVWQHNKPRVVTDHSSSGLNSGIPKSEGHVSYDDMHSFGYALREARATHPQRNLITFKSDVASAFLNLPAHPLWQLRQVVKVDDNLHIIRRLVFGNRASPRCWCAVSGLICWNAIKKFNILGLHVYMDDFFGWSLADDLVYFHGRLRPCQQVQLLSLWEGISCPFEDKKQDHGEVLKIIGFYVDINRGTITLSPDTITDIIAKVHLFLDTADRQPRLRDWQRLGGHLNWLLNVLPWGQPALSELYRKTSGKLRNPKIFINATI